MATWKDDLTSLVDGSTTVFQTTYPFTPGSTLVFLNTPQRRGAGAGETGTFYYESNPGAGEITCNEPPDVGDALIVEYEIAGSGDTVIDVGFTAHFRDPTGP